MLSQLCGSSLSVKHNEIHISAEITVFRSRKKHRRFHKFMKCHELQIYGNSEPAEKFTEAVQTKVYNILLMQGE